MTRLLVDNQLPVALSRFLTAEGIESMHVMDVALDEASDHRIWEYARSQGYVVVTKDEDFLHLSIADQHGPQLVWVRLGNCGKENVKASPCAAKHLAFSLREDSLTKGCLVTSEIEKNSETSLSTVYNFL